MPSLASTAAIIGISAIHFAYFTIVSDWRQPAQGALYLGTAIAATLTLHRLGLLLPTVRIAHALYAGFVLAMAVATNTGMLSPVYSVSMGDVVLGQGEWRWIPSIASVVLLVGIPWQSSPWLKALAAAAIMLNGSITGWLGLPVALWGWRGLPVSGLVWMMCVGVGGDVGTKATSRLITESQTVRPVVVSVIEHVDVVEYIHPWPYWMADLTSTALVGLALLRRDRSQWLLAMAGFRFGSTLWFMPVVAILLAIVLTLPYQSHRKHRPVNAQRPRLKEKEARFKVRHI